MSTFTEEGSRSETIVYKELVLNDFIGLEDQIRTLDEFVAGLDLKAMDINRIEQADAQRPCYRSSTMLKMYIYGYLNVVTSIRGLERDAFSDITLMWLLGGVQPEFQSIAEFGKNNREFIYKACQKFVSICRRRDNLLNLVNNGEDDDTQVGTMSRVDRDDRDIRKYLTTVMATAEKEPLGHAIDLDAIDTVISVIRLLNKAFSFASDNQHVTTIEMVSSHERRGREFEDLGHASGVRKVSYRIADLISDLDWSFDLSKKHLESYNQIGGVFQSDFPRQYFMELITYTKSIVISHFGGWRGTCDYRKVNVSSGGEVILMSFHSEKVKVKLLFSYLSTTE